MTDRRAGTALDRVLAYHDRTKHRPTRYARSPGFMDWSTQPDPFRHYEGAERDLLDIVAPEERPLYDELFEPGRIAARPLDREFLSRLFYDSLALSAWKQHGAARWSLRVNPSSGNLHPTEAYLIAGPVRGLTESPGLYHYAPRWHALEARAGANADPGQFTSAPRVGLTSIYWRESWKYGERAFRYCHLDVGHAIAAMSLSATALGWRARVADHGSDAELDRLLGVADQAGPEAEHADCLLALHAGDGSAAAADPPEARTLAAAARPLQGEPNRLSPAHHPWPAIDDVAQATAREGTAPSGCWSPPPVTAEEPRFAMRPASARGILRGRRSAVALDGRSELDRDTFFRMLERTLPRAGRPPFDALNWKPALHLLVLVHRVRGLEPGIYVFPRNDGGFDAMRDAFGAEFEWEAPAETPPGLPLFRLAAVDCRDLARDVSCRQEIASDGAFAVAMLAEFEPRLRADGAWLYRRLYWEAGAIGQLLYVEAEAAGLRGTGIGCFFDDEVHSLLGMRGRGFQDLYHFTVGGPLEDPRLRTLPPYVR